MASTSKPTRTGDPDYLPPRDGPSAAAEASDCAACHAPLPPGHRYLCEACVADSTARADAILSDLATSADTAPPKWDSASEGVPDTVEAEEIAECPNCGMRLDASGRCAGCVTTVRR